MAAQPWPMCQFHTVSTAPAPAQAGSDVGVAVRGGPAHRGLPGAARVPDQAVEPALGVGTGLGTEDPRRRDDVLQRALDLLPGRRRELGRREQRLEHRRDLGVVGEVDVGEPVDQGRRGAVGDEAHGQLGGDPPGRLGVAGEVGQVGLPDLLALGRGVGVRPAQDAQRALVVADLAVVVLAGLLVGRHAGEGQCRAADVALEVAAGDPDGVQLEHLAAEVLVGSPLGRRLVVELGEHRRVLGRGHEHVGEAAEGETTDDVDLVAVHAVPRVAPGGGDHEVVGPEVDHHLEQLASRPQGAGDVGTQHVVAEVTRAVRVVLVVHLPRLEGQAWPLWWRPAGPSRCPARPTAG